MYKLSQMVSYSTLPSFHWELLLSLSPVKEDVSSPSLVFAYSFVLSHAHPSAFKFRVGDL